MLRVLLEDINTFLSVVGILDAPEYSHAGGTPVVRGKCGGQPVVLSVRPNVARGDFNVAIRAVASELLPHGTVYLARESQDQPALAETIRLSVTEWTRQEALISDRAIADPSTTSADLYQDVPDCDALITIATQDGRLDADCVINIRSFIRILAKYWGMRGHAR